MANRGLTLIELVVVLSIIAILLSIAIPQFTKWKKKYDKQSDVLNLYEFFQDARIKAFTQKATCGVTWKDNTFSLICDTDGDGKIVNDADGGFKLIRQLTPSTPIEIANQLSSPLLFRKDGTVDLTSYSSGCSCSSSSCGFETSSGKEKLCNYLYPEGGDKCIGFYITQIKVGRWDNNGCVP